MNRGWCICRDMGILKSLWIEIFVLIPWKLGITSECCVRSHDEPLGQKAHLVRVLRMGTVDGSYAFSYPLCIGPIRSDRCGEDGEGRKSSGKQLGPNRDGK